SIGQSQITLGGVWITFDLAVAALIERNPLLEGCEELTRLQHRVIHDLADTSSGDRHRQRFWLQSCSVAGWTRPWRHVLLQVFANELALGLFEPALEVGNDALVVRAVLAAATAL